MALAARLPGRPPGPVARRTSLGSSLAAGVAALLLLGCPAQSEQPAGGAGPAPDTACPKDFPTTCKVLKDSTDVKTNSTEYHVLLAADTKHSDAEKLLKSLYRHLMTRRDTEPAALAGYLYTSEAQFSTPPASPVASLIKSPEAKIPLFENKIALELWQQVEYALDLAKRDDRKFKRQLAYRAEADTGRVTVTVPYTESGKEDWAAKLSFSQVMNQFTESTQLLFSRAPDLKQLHYVGVWQDKEVARIEVSRAEWSTLQLREVEERIGSLHGRVFQELSLGKGNDESADRSMNARVSAEYRKVLAQLKGHAFVSPQLK